MKRFFFSLIALAAAAVSCTQSALLETPTLDGTPVSFSPYTGRTPVTKATSIATAAELGDEGGFNVYCFLNGDQTQPLLDAKPVTMTDGVWGYTNTIFWPASGTLDFVAYSANAKDHLTDASSTGFTFTVPDAIDNQVDLLATAYQAGKTATSDGVSSGNVTLKFSHLLSRVGFKVQTGSTRAFTVKSLSITGDTPVGGTLKYTDSKGDEIPTLTPSAAVEDKAYFFVNSPVVMTGGASDATAITGMDSKYLMIMPHDAAGHTISITYTIGDSEIEKTATAELPAGFEFVQGKAYEFILKISTSALTFDVMEEDWNKTGDVTLVEPFKPTGYDPDVDKATKEEYGMVYNVVAYNPDSHLLTIKIDLYKNKVPAGANGFRISMKSTYNADGTENNSWNSPQYLQYKNGSSYNSCNTTGGFTYDSFTKEDVKTYYVYLNNKSQLPKNTECTISCYYYSTSAENNSTLKTKFQNNTKYQKKFSTTSIIDHTEYYENQTTAGGSTNTPMEDPIVTIYNISVDQTAKTASVTGNFIDGRHKITSRGFCWMTGEGTPTTNNEYIPCGESDPFSATITGLAEGINSCRAYVTTEDGNTHYSELRTIEIEPTVNEEDNTGSGSWGNGGNEDFN